MATCEGVTALVTLMLAIWSKIRVLESKFVTKGGRQGVKAGLGCLTLGEGGWAVAGEEEVRARKELEQMVIR